MTSKRKRSRLEINGQESSGADDNQTSEEEKYKEKVPQLVQHLFPIKNKEQNLFSALASLSNHNDFFTHDNKIIKDESLNIFDEENEDNNNNTNPFLVSTSNKKEKEEMNQILLTKNYKNKYQIDNLSEYNFSLSKYISKGKGYCVIELINGKYYLVFRNMNLQILYIGEILSNISTFDISKTNSVIGVINKLIVIENSKINPSSIKLKFNSNEARNAFTEEFSKLFASNDTQLILNGAKEEQIKNEKPKTLITSIINKPEIKNDNSVKIKEKPKLKIVCVRRIVDKNINSNN